MELSLTAMQLLNTSSLSTASTLKIVVEQTLQYSPCKNYIRTFVVRHAAIFLKKQTTFWPTCAQRYTGKHLTARCIRNDAINLRFSTRLSWSYLPVIIYRVWIGNFLLNSFFCNISRASHFVQIIYRILKCGKFCFKV